MTDTHEVAIFAGGCFWGMQDLIRKLPGIVETRAGYTGGTLENPTYADICTGKTGHAEAIRIVFDAERLPYRRLVEFFFQIHDPTTLNRQGNDVGSQYRSAIFFTNPEQERVARETIRDIEASGNWPGRIVTEVGPAGPFYDAEEGHQDYLEKFPEGYSCHYVRPDWALPETSDA